MDRILRHICLASPLELSAADSIHSACCFALIRILAWKLPSWVNLPTPADPYGRRDMFEILYPVEITFGIIGACLPMLRPILHRKEYSRSRSYDHSGQSLEMGRVRSPAGSRTGLVESSNHDRSFSREGKYNAHQIKSEFRHSEN